MSAAIGTSQTTRVDQTDVVIKHFVTAPNGQQVEVDRSYEGQEPYKYGDCGGEGAQIRDTRPRVFTAAGQGEASQYTHCRGGHPLQEVSQHSWRAKEGVDYEAAGFAKTARGYAFYDPRDSVQAAAAKAHDAYGTILGIGIFTPF